MDRNSFFFLRYHIIQWISISIIHSFIIDMVADFLVLSPQNGHEHWKGGFFVHSIKGRDIRRVRSSIFRKE